MPDAAHAPAYTPRPALAGDFGFLHDLHVACLKPYVEATWGWDEAIPRAIFAEGFAPERSRIGLSAAERAGVIAAAHRAADWFIAEPGQGRAGR